MRCVNRMLGSGAVMALLAASGALAQVTFNEIEPNEGKFTATSATPMNAGDMLVGLTTGSSTTAAAPANADYWRVQTAMAPAGIYRYRLVLTSDTLFQTGTIRGLNQSATTGIGTTDSTVQTASTATFPPRYVQWYGFGRQEEIYYRVTGTTSASSNYTATLERELVSPFVITDPIVTGPVTISTIGQTTVNTDLWLYDANRQAIFDAGNDDESVAGGGTGTTAQSLLRRTLSPGTYYLAITNVNLANSFPAPADDDVRTGIVLDFPDAVANSSATTNQNVSFQVGHLGGFIPVAATKFDAFDIVWVEFTVVPDTANRPPVGFGRATPGAGFNDGTSPAVFSVEVTPGNNPVSTGIAVTLDGSPLGLGTLNLLDNGVAPDQFAGDNIFTGGATIPSGAPGGPTSLGFTITDTQMRSSTGNIAFTVNAIQFDFGDVSPGANTSQTLDTNAGEVKWFKFSASGAIDAGLGTFMDIDTEFSAGCQDTEVGVYRSDGTLVASDDDDGSGGVGVSSLSFGAGTRPAATSCGTGGVAYNGRDGTLNPDTYYIAVGRFNVTYGTTAFNATSTGPAGSGIQLNIRANALIGSATPSPATVLNDGSSASIVTITAPLPLTAVTIDGSSVGASNAIVALDDGVAPDAVAGDNRFTARLPVADGHPAGAYQVPYSISNGMQTSPGTFTITVVETVGACCQPGSCSVIARTACNGGGGMFLGHGVPCVDSPGYNISPTGAGAFEDISFTGFLVTATGDDTVFQGNPIGFDFPFLGNVYNTCNISTNGNIQFPPSASTAYQNMPIPTAGVPNNAIFPLWDDFNFNVNTVDDGLYIQTLGTPGVDLRFIVQWHNVSQFGVAAPGDRNTFQAVLFEDGRIEFRYGQLGDISFDSIAGSPGATVGTENIDGTAGNSYDYLNIGFGNTALALTTTNGGDNCTPDCAVDFNGDGELNADDLSDYITCFFTEAAFPGACPDADFNGVDGANADDLSDYITAYFFGC